MEHPRTTKNVGQPCVICGQPANAQATVEALQRERDQWKEAFERSCDDTAHLKAALDAEREKVKGLESEGVKLFEWRLALHSLTPGGSEFCTPDACEQWVRKSRTSQHEYIIEQIKQRKGLRTQLSQLQALVRAFFTSEDKWAVAYRELERLGYTLDATTPAVCPDCDGDGAVDSGGTDPNGNPLMRRCGCREKGGDGEPAECTNHFTDGSKIFPSRNCCSKGAK